MAYVELHCHSAFSFLDGASLPDELVAAAVEVGHKTLALTDHNSVSGSMEFAVAARALGLRPIHGAEIDLEPSRHLTLLVEEWVANIVEHGGPKPGSLIVLRLEISRRYLRGGCGRPQPECSTV